MTDPGHRDLAARAVAMGAVVAYPYANIYVFSSRPDEDLVRYVNQVKGRPPEQTAASSRRRSASQRSSTGRGSQPASRPRGA